jgi:hypothetical protein
MSTGAAGLSDVVVESFSTKSERRPEGLSISLKGNADMAIHEKLKAFLESVDEQAKRHRMKEVSFELQDLYFMNSSCLSLLLRMINGIIDAANTHKYKVRFRSNPNLRWQKKSLQALHSYAQDIVVIE